MSGECILVIDDSKEIVKHLTEHVLPAFGYQTLHAVDGKTGLKLIRERKPDLVMLDYNLPEMTGIDVLQQMAQESISTPVVLMTGYGSEQSAIEAFRLGAKDYLVKPFTVDEIVETIDRALVETRLLHDKQELAEQLRRVKVEMSRQTHEMNTLFNIGKAITSLLSVDKVLERVLEAATYLTDAEESTIWRPDETEKYVEAYEKQGNHGDEAALPRLSISDSQVGQVMRSGRPLRQSVFTGKGIKVTADYSVRAVLYVPLKLRGVTVGVLGVSNRTALRSFSKRDEFLLSFLADYAAIALENASVFQAADQALASRLDELNTLIDITRTITSSLDLDEVVRLTIQQVHHSWHIEASSLWLLDETRQSLSVLANVGTPPEVLAGLRVAVGQGLVGHVARTGKWTYTNDVASHPQHYRQVDVMTGFKTRSLLCVPLMYHGRVIGAMQLLNKLDGDFDDRDVERARTIAAAVAIAVTNALLFQEAEVRKRHLEVTLEYNNNPILITDTENNLRLLNREARKRLGLTEEVIGQSVDEVVQPARLIELLNQPAPKAPEAQDEVTLADSSTWLPHVALIPNYGRILILQDISGFKEVEQARDHFVATISHDMRSPLNTISSFMNNLTEAGPLNEVQQMSVQHVLHATEQMMGQVNGLLELAQVTTHLEQTLQMCDIQAIVSSVVHELEGQALARQIELVLQANGEPGPVQGDPEQLRRAVTNLIDNAIKYSPAEQQVQITLAAESDSVLLSVEDAGLGIGENDLPHIFDKFYRGQASHGTQGAGLGLALVDSIVRKHKGEVWVKSHNGHGTIFFVRLPVTAA